jgi:hypothetical protein
MPTEGFPFDGDVAVIDISSFSGKYIGNPRSKSRTAKFFIFLFGLAAAVFVVIVFLWYVVDEATGERYSDLIGNIALGVVILLLAGAIGLVMRDRLRWFAGLETLIAPNEFSADALKRPIPEVGFTLGDLVNRLGEISRRLGPIVDVKRSDPAQIAKARLHKGLAIAFLVIAVILIPLALMGTLIFATLAIAQYVSYLRAAQPTIEEVRSVDKRKPILMLRSFRDDQLTAPEPSSLKFYHPGGGRRLEQIIAGSFRQFGTFIAIGEPGEKLPQLGAARSQLSGDAWQSAVLGWIHESTLIVMLAGTTQWITWELHRVVEQNQFGKLMILLPPEQISPLFGKKFSARAARWQTVLDAFADRPWGAALARLDLNGLLVVQLENDGKVVGIRSHNSFLRDYKLAVGLAIYSKLGQG